MFTVPFTQLQRTLEARFAQILHTIEPILHHRFTRTVLTGIKFLAHTHFAFETVRFLHYVWILIPHFAK